MEDRDTKIANYRHKKALEANLDRLRNYENEEMKREFYLNQIRLSILNTFEQMRLTELELDIQAHAASLSQEQIAANLAASAQIPRSEMKPLEVTHIGPEDIKRCPHIQQLPYLVSPQSGMDLESNVIQEYIDPMRKYKPIDQIFVRNEDINDRMTLRSQYQKQVFQPGHNLPTMSIEELADMEVADALARQEKDKEREAAQALEDPDDEEVLEA